MLFFNQNIEKVIHVPQDRTFFTLLLGVEVQDHSADSIYLTQLNSIYSLAQ